MDTPGTCNHSLSITLAAIESNFQQEAYPTIIVIEITHHSYRRRYHITTTIYTAAANNTPDGRTEAPVSYAACPC